jgi:hypothetical protein
MAQYSGVFNLPMASQAVGFGNWPNAKPKTVQYLVVAGGGGSGAGGGGGGGFVTGEAVPVTSGSAITVTVGAGGASNAGPGSQGSNSVFGSITTVGGGGGGWRGRTATNGYGGSGGGGTADSYGNGRAAGVAGQGYEGGSNINGYSKAPGGGGAGGPGGDVFYNMNNTAVNGVGGIGMYSMISGTNVCYSNGCGGTYNATNISGGANTGDGAQGQSGAGGSGIVVISYPDTLAAATSTTGSPTITKSGVGSLYLDGSSGVTYPSASQFDLYGSSFTIQCWMYMTATTGYRTIVCKRPAGGGPSYSLKIPSGSNSLAFGNTANEIAFSGSVTYNTWMHIAIVCDGTNTNLYMNGVYDSTVALAATSNNSVALAIGGNVNNGNEYMTGYISNLQIIKGVQLYTSNFTPSNYPVINANGSNTSLLMNTATPSVGADLSSYVNQPTLSGTASWNSLTPFATGLGLQNRVYKFTSSGSITF